MTNIRKITTSTTNELYSFKDLDLNTVYNKNILLETVNGFYYGKAISSKTGLAVINSAKETNINIFDIKSIVCEQTKTTIKETIRPQNIELWNKCLTEAKKTTVKGILHKTCKCYESENVGWESNKKKIQEVITEQTEDLILRDSLKNIFFENRKVLLEKDIRNHEHENSMSPEEIAKRDEIARGLMKKGKCKIVNKKDKTVEQACHRMATRLVLGRGSGYATQSDAGDQAAHHHHLSGGDAGSRRGAVGKGHYNKLATAWVPGHWHKANKHGFFGIDKSGTSAGKSRKKTWLATVQHFKKHVSGMTDYRIAMANTVKDPGKRAELLRNIRQEASSRTAVQRRSPRKSRAKKKP